MERIAILSAVAAQLALVWASADIFCRVALHVNGLPEASTLLQAHGQEWLRSGPDLVRQTIAALIARL